MPKPKESTTQAISEAYSASGTWRQLAADIGLPETDAVTLSHIARKNRHISGRTENRIRRALGLGPIRRRNPRIDIDASPEELAIIMTLTPRQRAERMLARMNYVEENL